MRRILIAATVVAGMTLATSSAMAQSQYYGGTRGVYRSPATVQLGIQSYSRSARPYYRSYRSGYDVSSRYYSPRSYRGRTYSRTPSYYPSRSYYRSPSSYRSGGIYNRSGYGVQRSGFSIGIGY